MSLKIVYLISTVGHGKGGHFHSLATIANAMGKTNPVTVINIGRQESQVVKSGDHYNYQFVYFNGKRFFKTLKKLANQLKEIQPEIIHAFDVQSFAFSRILSRKFNTHSILSKCGGPNPKRYFPVADKMVLFSQENHSYFNQNSKYNHTEVALIPNRVTPFESNEKRVAEFWEKHKKEGTQILRIARIGKHYFQSIIQGINLVKFLLESDTQASMIILGTIQDQQLYEKITDHIKKLQVTENVIIETSDQFTTRASELLGIGDVIIGTGRNFMEACSLNKKMLVPYHAGEFPVLVSDNNFNEIFQTNFSPRTQLANFNANQQKEELLTLEQYTQDSKKWFAKYFNVENGINRYTKLYKSTSKPAKLRLTDLIINVLYCIKTFK